VVFPEGRDERIIRAARILKDENIAMPIVLGKPEDIKAATKAADVGLDGIETINPKKSNKVNLYAEKYIERRRDVSSAVAKRLVAKPLLYAGMMVASGDAKAVVGGLVSATSTIIQAAALTIGLTPGSKTASSYFLMIVPKFPGEENKRFIFADCAVNINPDAEQLADIALAAARNAEQLLDEQVRVAMLSFSTKGSAFGADVDKVKKAMKIARSRKPELAIDGEFQVDTAIVPQVAAKKLKVESVVAGRANVLIFPDLDAANIAYKLTQYMAGAAAIGPFLQGFASPVTDLSRGASVDDIIAATIITLVQCSD